MKVYLRQDPERPDRMYVEIKVRRSQMGPGWEDRVAERLRKRAVRARMEKIWGLPGDFSTIPPAALLDDDDAADDDAPTM